MFTGDSCARHRAGYYAMAGMPTTGCSSPRRSRGWRDGGADLAIGASTQARHNFEIVATSEAERGGSAPGWPGGGAVTADMDPVKAAGQMDVDEVVRCDEIRALSRLWMGPTRAAATAGQEPAHLSLHDIAAIGGEDGQ